MLEDDRCLMDYLCRRNSVGAEGILEPRDLQEIVIAQRVANRAK